MLNYKIIAKSFVNRLKKILPQITDHDQKGFVKGRYIGDNILKLISLIEYCDKENIPAFFLSCVFYKAFDTISHKFYMKSLETLGFGPVFCASMERLYEKCEAAVINNGHLTERFALKRVFKQGDPLSSINFIISLQIVTSKLK